MAMGLVNAICYFELDLRRKCKKTTTEPLQISLLHWRCFLSQGNLLSLSWHSLCFWCSVHDVYTLLHDLVLCGVKVQTDAANCETYHIWLHEGSRNKQKKNIGWNQQCMWTNFSCDKTLSWDFMHLNILQQQFVGLLLMTLTLLLR